MKTDEEIVAEVAVMAPIVGPTHAAWYAEACLHEYDTPHDVLLWSCRLREAVRRHAQDMGALLPGLDKLIDACEHLDEAGRRSTMYAIEEVQKALWWRT